MVRHTSSGGGLPTCQLCKACLEGQKSYSPDTICYGRTDERKDAHTDHYRALMNVHKDEPSRQWSKYANMGRLNLTCNNECL